jgi:hypothetical protein
VPDEAEFVHYGKYDVRLTRRQALRALLRRRPVRVDGSRVSPVISFGTGTSRVRIEAWGGGGGSGA